MTLHGLHLRHRASSVRVKGSRLMGRLGQRFNVWELTHGAGDHWVTNFRSLFANISATSDPFPSGCRCAPGLGDVAEGLGTFFIRVPQVYPGAAETRGALGLALVREQRSSKTLGRRSARQAYCNVRMPGTGKQDVLRHAAHSMLSVPFR